MLQSPGIRDPKRRCEPQALLSTDPELPASHIVGHFVRRWAVENTSQETRVYFGMEGERQWNDLAIALAPRGCVWRSSPGDPPGATATKLADLGAAGHVV